MADCGYHNLPIALLHHSTFSIVDLPFFQSINHAVINIIKDKFFPS